MSSILASATQWWDPDVNLNKDGTKITSWIDRNNASIVQAPSVSEQPTTVQVNSHNMIRFDGSQVLQVPSASNESINKISLAMVWSMDASDDTDSNNRAFRDTLDENSSSLHGMLHNHFGQNVMFVNMHPGGNWISTNITFPSPAREFVEDNPTIPFLVIITIDSDTDVITIRVNGYEKKYNTAVNYLRGGEWVFGQGYGAAYYKGNMGDWLYYKNRTLTTAECEELECYFSYKYNITMPPTLTCTVPYADVPPLVVDNLE